MKRTFIALPVKSDNKLVNTIEMFIKKFQGAEIKWISDNKWHFTLAFLGDTDADNEIKVESILQCVAKEVDVFNVRFTGIGVFPDIRRPKIIWISIAECHALSDFAELIRQKLKESDIGFDNKKFVAHLTIGRVKKVLNYKMFKDQFNSFEMPEIIDYDLDELVYYQSVQFKNTPEYRVLKSWKLNINTTQPY